MKGTNIKSNQKISNETADELKKYSGWKSRYARYYDGIRSDRDNYRFVKAVMDSFQADPPLTKYLSIGKVNRSTNNVEIDLRISGYSVATYSVQLTQKVKDAIKSGMPVIKTPA
jgi:hypothetical protein